MIDEALQSKLAALHLRPKSRVWRTSQIAVIVIALLVGIASGFVARGELRSEVDMDVLGRLAIAVAERDGGDPISVWNGMERHIGLKADEFSVNDYHRALQYLSMRINRAGGADVRAPIL